MWGRIGGRAKISIAREILDGALDWLPSDLMLALRVYGHEHAREARDCRDSRLLVPFAPDNRGLIREAISGFQPRGQTPIAYSLEQISGDFGPLRGERAVVLVTDGLESCGGDPVAAARALRARGIPVHVIGFGLGGGDEDTESLRAIADVSGGIFVAAHSAEELRQALEVTVGTAFRVLREGRVVASGTLGAGERIALPGGSYQVRLESDPPYEVALALAPEESVTLLLKRERGAVFQATRRARAEGIACEPELQASTPLPAVPTPLPPVPIPPLPPAPIPAAPAEP
jgi:hypothetical protein